MEVVRSIRQDLGLDAPNPTEVERMLGRALEHLADQLYRTDTHFVLEFIQNAEDNSYHPDVTPTLSLRIEDYFMGISCNERGFDESNVRAICNIGTSTKKHLQGFIGEKGIGFNSVFKVANVVRVASGDFRFKFDRDERLGMIAPIWEDDLPVQPGWTDFHLELTSLRQSSMPPGMALSFKLDEVKASLLLFLQRLRFIELDFALSDPDRQRIITLFRYNIGPGIVKLTHCENDCPLRDDFYLMVNHFTDMSATQEPKRPGFDRSEIVLAFPIAEDFQPVFSPQDVHVFLPLRPFGFNFVIQADFLTSSSREDILADSRWNKLLRDGLVTAFVQAIERFNGQDELRDTWFGYLPHAVLDPFFSEVEPHLLRVLSNLPIIRNANGVYRRPREVLVIPTRFRDKTGIPLIPGDHLPKPHTFISPDYDLSVRVLRSSLKRLGVQDMDDDVFVKSLEDMGTGGAIPHQSIEWHETVCDLLYHFPKTRKMQFHPSIRNLNILPLANGSWVRAATAPELVFDLELSGIPDDISLCRISRQVQPSSSRYQLFSALGVKPADPKHIARRILKGKTGNRPKLLVQRARFFFDYRDPTYSLPKPLSLVVISESLRLYQGQSMYLDLPEDGGRLRELLPRTTPFLHSLYLEQYEGEEQQKWFTWLQDVLAVNTAPCLISGALSEEFIHSIKNTAADKFLLEMRYFWPRLKGRISDSGLYQLSQAVITLEDRTTHRLDLTFVRRRVFSRFHAPTEITLPFLPIADPDSEEWDFLRSLGVVVDVNANYFLKLLVLYQTADCRNQHTISGLYQQLSSRFDENADLIRDTFKRYPLILAPGEGVLGRHWFTRMEAHCNGPPTMVTKFAVNRAYDTSFREFFYNKLGVRNTPYTTLLDELKQLVKQWRGRALSSEAHERISDMLVDLWDLVFEERIDLDDLRRLAGDTIFPVRSPQGEVYLMSLKEFYLPDRDERIAKLFAGRIPLLAIGTSHRPSAIYKLLTSPALKPHVKHLASSVNRQHEHHGVRRFDTLFTSTYARKFEFIERLIYRSAKPSARQLSSLEKIQNMAILRVDKIVSTLTVEEVSITTSDAVSVMEDPSSINILISSDALSNTREGDVHMEICVRLGSLLELEVGSLLQAVTTDVGTLRTLYAVEGIPELDHVGLFQNRGWLHDSVEDDDEGLSLMASQSHRKATLTPHSTAPWEPTQTGCSEVMGNGPQQVPKSKEPLDKMRKQVARMAGGLATFTVDESTVRHSSVIFSPQSVQDLLRPAPSLDMELLSASPSRASNGSDTNTLDRAQRLNALLGERFVFAMLSDLLGDSFGPDNWTSEARGIVDEFTLFEGSSLSDFTYHDQDGILTRIWYDGDSAVLEAWEGKWPTYHIEVKSTAGTAQDPFQISRHQLDIALNLTEREDIVNQQNDVYVLIRVWGVRKPSSTSCAVYVDPFRRLCDGGLKLVSDSVELMMGD